MSGLLELLLSAGPAYAPRQLRLSLASASLADLEHEALSAVAAALGRSEAEPSTVLPLEYYDETFSEWCVLTSTILPALPSILRLRTAAVAAAAAAASAASAEQRNSLSGYGGASGYQVGSPVEVRGPPGPSLRHSVTGGQHLGGHQIGESRSLLKALAAEHLTALPIAAIWLEDRLKTVSLGTVCVVALGFLAWYLQSALQMLLVAGLLAILLEPLARPCVGSASHATSRTRPAPQHPAPQRPARNF